MLFRSGAKSGDGLQGAGDGEKSRVEKPGEKAARDLAAKHNPACPGAFHSFFESKFQAPKNASIARFQGL